MTKSEDIARLDRVLKDAEIRIQTTISNVEALTKEIDVLSNEQKVLEENVKCLKKNRIIAIAQEFKKSKMELERVRSKIVLLCNDRERLLKTIDDMETFIKKTQAELEKLNKVDDSNVLRFNTKSTKDGKKDGQE